MIPTSSRRYKVVTVHLGGCGHPPLRVLLIRFPAGRETRPLRGLKDVHEKMQGRWLSVDSSGKIWYDRREVKSMFLLKWFVKDFENTKDPVEFLDR